MLFHRVGQSVIILLAGNFNRTCSSFSFSVALMEQWKNATMALADLIMSCTAGDIFMPLLIAS